MRGRAAVKLQCAHTKRTVDCPPPEKKTLTDRNRSVQRTTHARSRCRFERSPGG